MKSFCKQILFLFLFCLANSSYGQYKNIPKESIEDSLKLNAYNFAYGLLDFCEESSIPKLDSTNAEMNFVERFDLNMIYDSCSGLSLRFGKIKGIELVEILRDKNDFKIFRYKVKRKKSEKVFEFVIYLSETDKFSGIEDNQYWSDNYTKRQGPLKRIALKGLSDLHLKDIQDFASRSFKKCNISEFEALTKENTTAKVLKWMTVKWLVKECASYKKRLGNFENLRLTEGLSDLSTIIIYRFKADFEKLDYPSEIRLYRSIDNKFMGIFVIDKWSDEFHELKGPMKKQAP